MTFWQTSALCAVALGLFDETGNFAFMAAAAIFICKMGGEVLDDIRKIRA